MGRPRRTRECVRPSVTRVDADDHDALSAALAMPSRMPIVLGTARTSSPEIQNHGFALEVVE